MRSNLLVQKFTASPKIKIKNFYSGDLFLSFNEIIVVDGIFKLSYIILSLKIE